MFESSDSPLLQSKLFLKISTLSLKFSTFCSELFFEVLSQPFFLISTQILFFFKLLPQSTPYAKFLISCGILPNLTDPNRKNSRLGSPSQNLKNTGSESHTYLIKNLKIYYFSFNSIWTLPTLVYNAQAIEHRYITVWIQGKVSAEIAQKLGVSNTNFLKKVGTLKS